MTYASPVRGFISKFNTNRLQVAKNGSCESLLVMLRIRVLSNYILITIFQCLKGSRKFWLWNCMLCKQQQKLVYQKTWIRLEGFLPGDSESLSYANLVRGWVIARLGHYSSNSLWNDVRGSTQGAVKLCSYRNRRNHTITMHAMSFYRDVTFWIATLWRYVAYQISRENFRA